MNQVDRNDVEVGMVFALCCLHDLCKVTEDDLEEIKTGYLLRGVWRNYADAMRELLPECDSDEIDIWLRWRASEYPLEVDEIYEALRIAREDQ